MASFSDDLLMAYADGELDAQARDQIEAALRDDQVLAQRVARHRALRDRIQSAFATELAEPVPQRLLDAARGALGATVTTVTDLEARRGLRDEADRRRRRWQLPLSLAASVLVGVGIGYGLLHDSGALIEDRGDGLVARGALAGALSTLLGSDPTKAVRVNLSFRSKTGEYCRVFTLQGQASRAGLACRGSDGWQILALAPSMAQSAPESQGEYRTAGSDVPTAILDVVQQTMLGDPLDGTQESSARGKNWQAEDLHAR